MSLAIIINRFCKLSGTILKAFAYLIYFIFPKLRFTIPKVSKAKILSKKSSLVPKIIWQTNYSNIVTLPVYVNYLFNRLMSLDWEYRYVSTEDRLEYIKQNAPKNYIDAFEQLTDGAAQADFWRLFVLNNIGGVYMDIDAHVVLTLSKLINPEDKELFIKSKVRYNNYFLATAPNNKHFKNTLDLIVDNKLILEIKTVDFINDVHKAQLLTYLKMTNCKLGLLLNFRTDIFKDGVKRVVNGL